jgi:hypothetical protein
MLVWCLQWQSAARCLLQAERVRSPAFPQHVPVRIKSAAPIASSSQGFGRGQSVDLDLNNPYVQLQCAEHGDCFSLADPRLNSLINQSKRLSSIRVSNQSVLNVGILCSYCHVGISPVINQETDNVCMGCWACCLYSSIYRPVQDICPPWYVAVTVLGNGHRICF